MLVHLASLASLAHVKPLITHQANQFAGGLGIRCTLEFSGQGRETDKHLLLTKRPFSILSHDKEMKFCH